MSHHPQNIISEESIQEALAHIREFIERELELKNHGIRQQSEAIESLIRQRDELKQQLSAAQVELQAVKQVAEGKKQLVDKLLGDVARLNQDVEWYKRTYEQRSLFGVLKDKMRYLSNK